MLWTGQNASRDGLVLVGLRKHSAGPACRIEDLDSQFARYVISPLLIDGHSISLGCRYIRGWFVELEITFRVDRQSHGHDGHLGIELTCGIDTKHPGRVSTVIGDSQSPAVTRERDPIGLTDPGIDNSGLARRRVDPNDLLGSGIGIQNMAFAADGQVVGFDSFG